MGILDKQFIKSSAVVGIGNVMARGLGMIFFIIVARMYMPEDYGFIRYSIAIATIAITVVASGFPQTLVRYLAKYKDKQNLQDMYFSNSIAVIIPLLFLTLIITFLLGKLNVGVVSLIIGLTIYYTYLGIIRGFISHNRIFAFNVGNNIIKILLVMIIIYYLGFHSPSLVLIIFALSCLVPILFMETFKPLNIKFRRELISKDILNEVTKFAIPLIIANVAYTLLFSIDIICIEYYLGMEEVGFYGVAKTLTQIFLFVPTALSTILMPKIASLEGGSYTENLKLSMILTNLASFALLLFIFLFGELLVVIIFSSKYLGALEALYILSIGTVFYSVYMLLESRWIGIGKPIVHTKTMLTSMIVAIIGNVYLVPRMGIFGAGLAFTLASVVGIVLLGTLTFTQIHSESLE